MGLHFLDLPAEIRLQIYDLLLVDSSIVVQYLFVRKHFQSAFRSKTLPATFPQILRTCRQVFNEGSPALYGGPQFDCASCILGVERLCAQIGPNNFSHIKRLTLDPADLQTVASSLQTDADHGFYRSLECLSTTGHRIVDLNQAGWTFNLGLGEMCKNCVSAHQILHSHSLFRVLGQDSRKDTRSWADAIDDSNDCVKWRFVRSVEDLTADERVLKVDKLLNLASVILRRRMEGLSGTMLLPTPDPMMYGIKEILYP